MSSSQQNNQHPNATNSVMTLDDPEIFLVTQTNWYIPQSSWSLQKIDNPKYDNNNLATEGVKLHQFTLHFGPK